MDGEGEEEGEGGCLGDGIEDWRRGGEGRRDEEEKERSWDDREEGMK